MIEEMLIQYGALGIVAYTVWFNNVKMHKAIINNNFALARIEQTMVKCHKGGYNENKQIRIPQVIQGRRAESLRNNKNSKE